MVVSEDIKQVDGFDEVEEAPVCLRCMEPVNPLDYYCPNCGEASNQLTQYIPFVNISWQVSIWGRIWRQVWSRDVALWRRIASLIMVVWGAPVLLLGLLLNRKQD